MMWVFGYGSLIWRPDFPFVERRHGVIRGWKRRFWQGSTDHRGVPGAPGRVVTLLEERDAETFGVAYRVDAPHISKVLADLDHREKGGYERFEADVVHGGEVVALGALVYVATPDNPEFLGPAPTPDIAAQIARSHGPSGPNREYLLELDRALRELGAFDPHVAELAEAVRRLGHDGLS
jgi:cation transport regulator ChaC